MGNLSDVLKVLVGPGKNVISMGGFGPYVNKNYSGGRIGGYSFTRDLTTALKAINSYTHKNDIGDLFIEMYTDSLQDNHIVLAHPSGNNLIKYANSFDYAWDSHDSEDKFALRNIIFTKEFNSNNITKYSSKDYRESSLENLIRDLNVAEGIRTSEYYGGGNNKINKDEYPIIKRVVKEYTEYSNTIYRPFVEKFLDPLLSLCNYSKYSIGKFNIMFGESKGSKAAKVDMWTENENNHIYSKIIRHV
jgi:hypothetical protein